MQNISVSPIADKALAPNTPVRPVTATGAVVPALELVLLGLLAVLWGIPYALTKIALETIPPLTLVAARVSLAAAILWIVVLALKRQVPVRPGLVGSLFIQGCLCCTVAYTLIAWGQQSVDSALAALLNSASPLFVCLITLIWTRREPITSGRAIGVMMGLGGVALVTGVGAIGGSDRQTIGQMAILLATFASALGTIHGRRFADLRPEVAAAGMLTWAAVVLAPMCLLVEAPLHSRPSIASMMALAVNAMFGTALAFVLYFRLIRTLGSLATASVGYLKPCVGVLIGCALLGESFVGTMALGLVAVVAGVAAINRV